MIASFNNLQGKNSILFYIPKKTNKIKHEMYKFKYEVLVINEMIKGKR